jgi:hypothetical protein
VLLLALLLRGEAKRGFQAVAQSSRGGHTGAVIPILRTSLVAALVAGVLAAGGCSSSPRCPPGASCPAVAPRVIFTPTINGKTAVLRKNGHIHSHRVRPGENLVIQLSRVDRDPRLRLTLRDPVSGGERLRSGLGWTPVKVLLAVR